MKTIGLLGGMSWESTQSYYALINQGVKSALGGLHSARMLISSVDFAEIAELQRQGDWAQAGELLAADANCGVMIVTKACAEMSIACATLSA